MAENTASKTPQNPLAKVFFAPLELAYFNSLKPHGCPVISEMRIPAHLIARLIQMGRMKST